MRKCSHMPWLSPITLTGHHATLAPLSQNHHDDLVEAVKDGELWNLWFTTIAKPEFMRAEIDRRLDLQKKGTMLPFTVLRSGKAVGMTTYMNVDAVYRRVEIGSTWYRKSVQRSEEHTSELQSRVDLVCRLLLEKKK